jgi:protoporphyrinogen oxidase
MNNTKFDIIIIGAGIAGLYSAYKIRKQFPDMSVLLLERSPKNEIGGRAGNVTFQNTTVVTGAGIGRKEKDKFIDEFIERIGYSIR